MWEFIHKIALLFVERKNKFQNAEEKLERRIKYFEDIKAIDNLSIDKAEKRARKNGVAQALVGSQLVSFELIDYLIKNKNINNFEIVAKTLALWDTSLKVDRNENKEIIFIELNTWGFIKEKLILIIALLFLICMIIFSIYPFKYNVIWLKITLMRPEYISIVFMFCLIAGLLAAILSLFIMTIVLFDLKRIVHLLNK
ncbi:MAG TPA: hypothetical protein DCQ68_00235 [Chryseobacterium indologenes]|nr:hypothetical protein [Chryseobacterium indologenes]